MTSNEIMQEALVLTKGFANQAGVTMECTIPEVTAALIQAQATTYAALLLADRLDSLDERLRKIANTGGF